MSYQNTGFYGGLNPDEQQRVYSNSGQYSMQPSYSGPEWVQDPTQSMLNDARAYATSHAISGTVSPHTAYSTPDTLQNSAHNYFDSTETNYGTMNMNNNPSHGTNALYGVPETYRGSMQSFSPPCDWSHKQYTGAPPYSVPRGRTPAPGASTSTGSHRPPPPETIVLDPATEEDRTGIHTSSSSDKICTHCGVTKTSLWRRHPNTHKTLCNACGLFLHQRGRERPLDRIGAHRQGQPGGGPCANCGTSITGAWRRNTAGQQVCNACGMYEQTKGVARPPELRTDVIKPRSRH